MILSASKAQLLVIDIQEKLAPAMSDAGPVIANSQRLMAAARHFGVPITISEQYPRGIGPTVEVLRDAAGDEARVFDKMAFSCARDEAICAHLGLLREGARMAWTSPLNSVPRMRGIGFASPTVLRTDRFGVLFYFF
jgi:hypothetical protein